MHSPRIKIPAKISRQQAVRSWSGWRGQHSTVAKSLGDELTRFNVLVDEYAEENRRLRDTLAAFNSPTDTAEAQAFLTAQYEADIRQLSDRVDRRSARLDSLHKRVTREKPVEFLPIENRADKTQLLVENQRLIARALYLEKQMISAKLQLRLNHDHRDFCRLKREFARLSDDDIDGDDENEELDRNNQILHNLKRAIDHEKNRLLRSTIPPSMEDEAAELIQRHWRGDLARRHFVGFCSPRPDLIEEFPELAASDGEEASARPPTEEPPDEGDGEVLC
jgi:hypothetical protein